MPFEVGSLARISIALERENLHIKNKVMPLIKEFKSDITILNSLMGRHMCRAVEAKILVEQIPRWIDQLQIDSLSRTKYEIPENAASAGFIEAPRGALGHWITIKDFKIDNYQCVVPTTWNISPRDDKGIPGVIEQVLIGIPVSDINNPIEPARLIRSFDPCIACAVHAVEKV
jgi:Ni,Fe-hydrogenase I large subunit